MEVFPDRGTTLSRPFGLLHVRGGVSQASKIIGGSSVVFSTSVEVFLKKRGRPQRPASLLHVRGGVSYWANGLIFAVRSSPRPWRCFEVPRASPAHASVFSTSVEVFPKYRSASLQRWGLLHVRGGVSEWFRDENLQNASSPRPWRCFSRQTRRVPKRSVFSTSVEVFLNGDQRSGPDACLLHVRGGVSETNKLQNGLKKSSPRPWRCFPVGRDPAGVLLVFSTSVEVFPAVGTVANLQTSLLHVRGGVSGSGSSAQAMTKSSPRPWRCFQEASRHLRRPAVFSTSVEVFPTRDC